MVVKTTTSKYKLPREMDEKCHNKEQIRNMEYTASAGGNKARKRTKILLKGHTN